MRVLERVTKKVAEFIDEWNQSENILKIPLEDLELESNSKRLKEEMNRIKAILEDVRDVEEESGQLLLEIELDALEESFDRKIRNSKAQERNNRLLNHEYQYSQGVI